MYDELTKSDLQKMQEEIDYRVQVLRRAIADNLQQFRGMTVDPEQIIIGAGTECL